MLWLESGAAIKLSSGIQRSKTDKLDAKKIAMYAKRFQDKAKLYEPANESLEQIGNLQNERELYVGDRAKYKAQINDLKGFMDKISYEARKKRLQRLIKQMDGMIDSIDREIERLIQQDSKLARQFEIMCSLKGIGPQTATAVLVATKAFSKFDNARQFCCQIGVAPFHYSSGSSIFGKAKVSQRADKRLKSLFHMAALSAITFPGELKEYFERKVNQGKNKMSVINAIRAKLVHRIFALIRDDREYQIEYDNSYDKTLG